MLFKGISEKIAFLPLRFDKRSTMKIIQVYASTLDYDDEDIEFY